MGDSFNPRPVWGEILHEQSIFVSRRRCHGLHGRDVRPILGQLWLATRPQGPHKRLISTQSRG
jgi:hypothetical protein